MTASSEAELALRGEVTVLEPSRSERTAARRSAETRATVPSIELSLEHGLPAGERAKDTHDQILPAVLSAVAGALRESPRLNGAYRDGRFELYGRVNLGVTLPTEGGDVLATILDADTADVEQLRAELSRLRARAEAGELSAAERSGATFTVYDAGSSGVQILTPLIQPSQAAALSIATGHTIRMTLAVDSRIVDHGRAVTFLSLVGRRLERR